LQLRGLLVWAFIVTLIIPNVKILFKSELIVEAAVAESPNLDGVVITC
jgi:hypothetical protein